MRDIMDKFWGVTTNVFLYIWGSAWTAGGIFLAVYSILNHPSSAVLADWFWLLLILNISAYLVYSGMRTQIGLWKEWNDKND